MDSNLSQPADNRISAANSGNARNLSLDLLKGISMVLVVFFHNAQLNPDSFIDNLWMLACNAAVPCFFLVSGAVFFQRPFHLKRHIERLIRTYLALVAWRGLYLLFYGLRLGAGTGGSLRAFLSYLLTFQSIDGIPTGLFWFMEALLVVLFLAPILRLCRENSRTLTIYLLIILFLFNQVMNDSQLLITLLSRYADREVWNITSFGQINPVNNSYSNYVLYFLLGAELWERKDRISSKAAHKIIPTAMIAAGITGMVIVKYLQSGTFLWENTHITSGYYLFSTMLLACGMFLSVCLLPVNTLAPLRWFSKTVGSSTMGIFYLHTIFITILSPSLMASLRPWNSWPVNLLESCVITAAACAVTWLGKKLLLIRCLF